MSSSTPKKPWSSFIRKEVKPSSAGGSGSGSGGDGGGTPAAVKARHDGSTLSPYQHGDPIPRPDMEEKDTDTSWALFKDLSASENRSFADTAPPTDVMRYSAEERSYAATVPASLQVVPKGPARRELSVVEVMVEARRNNRVCPMPARWQQLYDMLPDKKTSGTTWEPSPPLIDAAWAATPSILKRVCFREHIEWADAHGCLQQVFTFMKSLPEDEWHHMGE